MRIGIGTARFQTWAVEKSNTRAAIGDADEH